MILLRVVTANIQNLPDMPRKSVLEDARTCSRLGEVILFQEIWETVDHADVAAGLGPAFAVVPFGTPGTPPAANPIAYRQDKWRLRNADHAKMVDGVSGICRDLYLTWVDLERRDAHLPPIRFANTHFVPPDKPDHQVERQRMWAEHYRRMDERVTSWRNAGWTVVFGGDFNRPVVERFLPVQQWVAGKRIDKIGYISTGLVRIAVGDFGWARLNSDHDALWADLGLHRRSITKPVPVVTD